MTRAPARDLSASLGGRRFGTILADPPWRFANRTGKVAPEHRRLARYETLSFEEIGALPVADHAADPAHLLPVGPERAAAARPARPDGVGIRIQDQPDLAQGPQGRRVGRPRRRLLLPQRDRDGSVRRERKERADARSGPASSEPSRQPQARAFPQTRRAIRHHRAMQPRAVSRIVRTRQAQRMDGLGKPGGGRLPAVLADLSLQFDNHRGLAGSSRGVPVIAALRPTERGTRRSRP